MHLLAVNSNGFESAKELGKVILLGPTGFMCLCIYMYTCVYVCMCVHMYVCKVGS